MTLDAVADLRDGSDAPAKEKRLKCHRSGAFTEEYLASCLSELRRGGSGTVPRASSTKIGSPEKSEEPAVVPTLEAPKTANKMFATSTPLRSQDDHSTDYQFSVCGEAFLTYQALGGHKTIHLAELSTLTITVPDEPSATSSTGNAPTLNVSKPSNPRDKAHICFICHRSFLKGQSLGGHMRRHYNERIRSSATTTVPKTTGNAPTLNVSKPSSPRDKAHVCFICHKSFPKGQSLGGHMRRHYKERIRSSAKTTVPNTTTFFLSSEDGVSIKKHHHDFDLNFSPPPEPAGEEHELG